MLLEISAVVAAAAFVVLVLFGVRTLHAVCRTLKQVDRTMRQFRKELDRVSGETAILLRHSSEIADRVHEQVKLLEPLAVSAGIAGEWVVLGIQWLKAWGARRQQEP